jgi:hypothetical protein
MKGDEKTSNSSSFITAFMMQAQAFKNNGRRPERTK